MRRFTPLLVLALAVGVVTTVTSPLNAQGSTRVLPPPPRFVTSAAGWVGPCDEWWATPEADFALNAKRVCRVTTYLMQAMQPTLDMQKSREAVDGLFRICWGVVPQSGGDCGTQNAWAQLRGWTRFVSQVQRSASSPLLSRLPIRLPPPIVITLSASEVLQSDDEVAFVLAHEMGHANDPEPERPNDREVEQRADILAVGLMVNAGFDARAGGRSLQNIAGERGQGAIGNMLAILNNHVNQVATQDIHGLTRDRIAAMKENYRRGCVVMNNRPIGCKQGWN